MHQIHETAIIEPGATIAPDAMIGPYCKIGPMVTIGSGTELKSHVVIEGNTTLGSGNTVYPFAVLGGRTQDLKFKGGNPGVKIGDNNTIREYVTVNSATNDGDFTVVGSNCLIMAYAHVAHCCQIGDQVIIANGCQIAGHVTVEEQATLEGLVGVVQFLRIGRMAFVGGTAKITKDIPPFMIADGNPAEIRGFNRIGMERRGIDEVARKSIKEAYRVLYRQKLTTTQALEKITSELEQTAALEELIAFCKNSEKGIAR